MKFSSHQKLFFFTLALMLILTACGTKSEQGAANGSGDKNAATASPTPTSTPKGKTWSQPPEMKIDANKKYKAIVTTSKGKFTIELFAKDAPKTVNNFVFLSKEGFYDNVVFHRIIKPFMVQTGDPKGNGTGGPGYKFEDELKSPYQYEPGIVAMANSGPNTNGSQFFICTGEQSKGLNKIPNYSIFGKVVEGMEIVQAIADTPVQAGNPGDSTPSMPTEKVTIQSVEIVEA